MAIPPSNKQVGDSGHTTDHNSITSAMTSQASAITALQTAVDVPQTVVSDAVGTIPVTVKGYASQTGDLMRFTDSADTVLAAVTSAGEIRSGSASGGLNGMLKAACRAATRVGVLVRGYSGQTANLIQAETSAGTTVFSVAADGTVDAPNIGAMLLVLDHAASVPGGTPAGTVILRRPAA